MKQWWKRSNSIKTTAKANNTVPLRIKNSESEKTQQKEEEQHPNWEKEKKRKIKNVFKKRQFWNQPAWWLEFGWKSRQWRSKSARQIYLFSPNWKTDKHWSRRNPLTRQSVNLEEKFLLKFEKTDLPVVFRWFFSSRCSKKPLCILALNYARK